MNPSGCARGLFCGGARSFSGAVPNVVHCWQSDDLTNPMPGTTTKHPLGEGRSVGITLADVMEIRSMNLDDLRRELRYEPETGAIYDCSGARRDRVAHGGYMRVRVGGRRFYAHRIAWLIVYGEWPQQEVDHINGDPSDNRLCNLRSATRTQNCGNVVKRPGVVGLFGVGVQSNTKRFRSRITVGGKNKHLGYFDTAEEAHEVAKAALDEYRREFSPRTRIEAVA